MSYHNEEIENTFSNFLKRIHETGRESDLVLLIPKHKDQAPIIARGGKVVTTDISPFLALALAEKGSRICHSRDGVAIPLRDLNDALCSFERFTSSEHFLLFYPDSADESVVMTRNGVSYPPDMTPLEALAMFMMERDKA